MSYFDGGEEIAVQPPYWRNQGRIALGVQARLKKPVILEGNALYTNLSWHVITRGSPSFDPIYFGRRDYTLRFKGQNPAQWANNLLDRRRGLVRAPLPLAGHRRGHARRGHAAMPEGPRRQVADLDRGRRQPSLGQQAHARDAPHHPRLRRTEAARTILPRRPAPNWPGRWPSTCWSGRPTAAGRLRPLQFGPAHVVDASPRRSKPLDVCQPARRADALAAHPGPLGPGALRSEGEHRARRSEGRRGHFQPDGTASADLRANRRAVARENARRRPGILLPGRESRQGGLPPGAGSRSRCPSRWI